MSDVFLSWASEDRGRVGRLASALERMGWSVVWDHKTMAGPAVDQTTARDTAVARCVVVLWSVNSVASEAVRSEAAAAAARGVLVPALIDNVKLPMEFGRHPSADLRGWQGNGLHPGFQALSQGVAHVVSGAAAAPPPRLVVLPPVSRLRWVLPASIALAVVLGAGLYAARSWRATPAAPATVAAPPVAPASANGPVAGPGGHEAPPVLVK